MKRRLSGVTDSLQSMRVIPPNETYQYSRCNPYTASGRGAHMRNPGKPGFLGVDSELHQL